MTTPDVAVTIPENILTDPNVETPVTTRELELIIAVTARPVNAEPSPEKALAVRVVPSIKFALSSNSPPVPTTTTRLFVKSSTFADDAVISPLKSARPVNVDKPDTVTLESVVPPVTPNVLAKVPTPATFKLSSSVSPSTSKFPLASIAPVNVDKPVTVALESVVPPVTPNVLDNVVAPVTVAIPATIRLAATSTLSLKSALLANVDKPATFKLSSSVSPSTSKFPLASIAPVNVDKPDTVTLESDVPAVTVTVLDKVAIPATIRLSSISTLSLKSATSKCR